jgi:hypothetical protein
MRPVLLLCLAAIVTGCGPGVTDGAYPIADGYLFYDTGGHGKTIRYGTRESSVTVVPERVDSYARIGDRLIVARRPAGSIHRGGSVDWQIEPTCEVWIIDLKTRDVQLHSATDDWPQVTCN